VPGFEPEPLINGVEADAEIVAGFTTFHAIGFAGFDDYATQVIVVGFGHRLESALDDGLFG
jgi:hypothetical protein